MMTWKHVLCADCWYGGQPGPFKRKPVLVLNAPPAVCCQCRKGTLVPIYIRQDPTTLACGGEHADP